MLHLWFFSQLCPPPDKQFRVRFCLAGWPCTRCEWCCTCCSCLDLKRNRVVNHMVQCMTFRWPTPPAVSPDSQVEVVSPVRPRYMHRLQSLSVLPTSGDCCRSAILLPALARSEMRGVLRLRQMLGALPEEIPRERSIRMHAEHRCTLLYY